MGQSGDGIPESVAARTAVAAVASGTASVLSGGKFANGAITGAFAQMFNAEGAARTLSGGLGRSAMLRMSATAATAATLATVDGPLPFGDVVGVGLLVYDVVDTVIGVVFQQSRPADFTPGQREAIIEDNKQAGDGISHCEDCGVEVRPIRNVKGVRTPDDQLQIHHDPAINKGGGRDSAGIVLCPPCHIDRHRD